MDAIYRLDNPRRIASRSPGTDRRRTGRRCQLVANTTVHYTPHHPGYASHWIIDSTHRCFSKCRPDLCHDLRRTRRRHLGPWVLYLSESLQVFRHGLRIGPRDHHAVHYFGPGPDRHASARADRKEEAVKIFAKYLALFLVMSFFMTPILWTAITAIKPT